MKKNIHPEYLESKVVCACGNTFVTRSTAPSISVEICSNCHPFFTGTQKLIDTAGRLDRFRAKVAKAAQVKSETKPKKARKSQPEHK